MMITTVNPATGQILNHYTEMSQQKVNTIIQATWEAHLDWRELDLSTRSSYLQQLASLLRIRKKNYALLIAQEMGKPLVQGEAEIEKCALVCEHYASLAAHYLSPQTIKTHMQHSYVTFQPLGVILAIMPWNFPFWQVFRFAAPNVMAGNGALLKHSANTTGCALAIEELFFEALCVRNIFRTLVITDKKVKNVIDHPKVMAVTLTGSPKAGQIVASQAAKKLKKSVLELGGNDPYIILEDADLVKAAEACLTSRMNNSGQSCIAAKRLIVIESIQKDFVRLIHEQLKKYTFGNPLDPQVNLGPLAREDLRDTVHKQVQTSIEQGAQLITGGTIPLQPGFYYPPTLLNHVQETMCVFKEEVFGPVLSIISAKDEEEAIQLANNSIYGLGAAIFTRNVARGERIAAEKIQAGTCAINTFIASDPRVPFGGIKSSGYGRELSAQGILSFVNEKTIHIK